LYHIPAFRPPGCFTPEILGTCFSSSPTLFFFLSGCHISCTEKSKF
jgi:hypothetical protein